MMSVDEATASVRPVSDPALNTRCGMGCCVTGAEPGKMALVVSLAPDWLVYARAE